MKRKFDCERAAHLFGCCALALLLGAAPAAATPERTLDKCQQTAGKEAGKYAGTVQKAVVKCLNKVSAEKIKNAVATARGAATTCVSALRKLENSEDPAKQLRDKARNKIAKVCDPGYLDSKAEHSSEDVVETAGPTTVAGETIQAERLGLPCLLAGMPGSGASGLLGTVEEWIDCQLDAAERGALRQVHVEYPRADAWMTEVRPAIQALATAGDVKAQDALVALAHARRWVDQVVMVYDRLTGLTWEKKTDDESECTLSPDRCWTTGFSWSSPGGPPYPPDGSAFTVLVYEMNGGATTSGWCASVDGVHDAVGYGGHCDWRLPTAAELQTILSEPYPCGSSPCIDPLFGPTQAFWHWSASACPDSPAGGAWAVNFEDGQLLCINGKLDDSFYARAVRGGL